MYKQITTSAEPKIIGVNNGISQLEFKDKELKKNSNYEQIKNTLITTDINSFLNIQHSVSQLEIKTLKGNLFKKAKITDIMTFSPYFFGYKYVVSEKFVDCLKEAEVNPNEYHIRKIEILGVSLHYYLLFLPMVSSDKIDFQNSLIYPEKDFLSDNKNYFDINNFSEYNELIKNSFFNRWEKITMNDEYSNRSIISLQAVVNPFFSNKLIDVFERRKISNVVIKDDIKLFF